MIYASGRATIPVLVTGGSPSLRDHLERALSVIGGVLASERPAVAFVVQDDNPPETSIGSVLRLRQRFPTAPLVFVATHGSEELAVAAFRAGACDYLNWPVCHPELERAWSRVVMPPQDIPEPFFLGQSEAIVRARNLIHRFAATPTSVLLTGETGSGKELAAKWLHRLSARASAPFVSVTCAAIPESLLESEVFGDARPGAPATPTSRLLSADGGTVFLDQVGELSPSAQARLLRVVEHREILRVGAGSAQPVDVRWISASSANLGALTREGRFRADLYYRLNAAEISLPPLRERPEDIGDLADGFLVVCAARLGERPRRLSPAALDLLLAHDWPGNVRELKNVVESSVIRAEAGEVRVQDLPLAFQPAGASRATRATIERRRVLDALHATAGNKTEAARRLNWSRMTLYRKLMRYRIPAVGQRASVTDLSSRHA